MIYEMFRFIFLSSIIEKQKKQMQERFDMIETMDKNGELVSQGLTNLEYKLRLKKDVNTSSLRLGSTKDLSNYYKPETPQEYQKRRKSNSAIVNKLLSRKIRVQ